MATLRWGSAHSVEAAEALADRGVLPIRGEEDSASLAKTAQILFGSHPELAVEDHYDHALTIASRSADVVSIGAETRAVGSWYARLTGRRHRMVEDELTDADLLAADVVVILADCLTPRLFDTLEDLHASGRIPGILTARNVDELWRVALVRAASLLVAEECSPSGIEWLDIMPRLRAGRLESNGRLLLGEQAELQDIRQALQSGAAVLRLVTHSDGVDAPLGEQAILCPLAEGHSDSGERPPLCISTGRCHRARVDVETFLLSENAVSPDQIVARILIMDACHVVITEPSAISAQWGLLVRLCASPTIACLFASPDFPLGLPSDLEALSSDLVSGVESGAALRSFYASAQYTVSGRRLFLFGDPRFAAQARSSLDRFPKLSDPPEDFPLTGFTTELSIDPETADRALAQCIALQGDDGLALDADDLAQAIIRRGWARWIEAVCGLGSNRQWRHTNHTCPVCNNCVREVDLQFPTPIRNRFVRFCSGCGPIEDRAYGAPDYKITFPSPDTVALFEPPKQRATAAYFAVWSYEMKDLNFVPWPRDPVTESAIPLQLKSLPLKGPRRVGAVCVGDGWTLMSYPLRIH